MDHTHNNKITGHNSFTIMRVHFPETNHNDNKPISITKLINHWSNHDQRCSVCDSPTERRTVIRVAPQYLFVSLCLFQSATRRIEQPVTGYIASNVVIAGKRYQTLGAVCHIGKTTESGHYWCLLRDNNRWLEINDGKITVKKRFINNLKNVYMLLLKRISAREEE